MSYLYIRYEDDDLTEYEFYDEINALMEKRGLNVDEDYMRWLFFLHLYRQ